ncbi:MAG: hypothetical protein WB987_15465 [Candidatus Acidiferrales bacterium]
MLTVPHFSGLALVLAAILAPAAAQEYRSTEQLRARFVQEADPIRKAKLLPPLGDSEFRDAHTALAEDKVPQALEILKLYVGEAQSCEKALNAKIADPEKHPNGFKQLQISVREAVRRMDAIIVGLSADDRTPFVEMRGQLDEIDRHLIQQLFPKQPVPNEPASPKR